LSENIEDMAILIDGPPEVMGFAIDGAKDFV
jgi:hypothetical protein